MTIDINEFIPDEVESLDTIFRRKRLARDVTPDRCYLLYALAQHEVRSSAGFVYRPSRKRRYSSENNRGIPDFAIPVCHTAASVQMRAFFCCTITNLPYIARTLALYSSLQRRASPFTLYVLCVDDGSASTLTALELPGMQVIPAAELEQADDDLRAVRSKREQRDYCYTCKSAFCVYLLDSRPEIKVLTFVDADTYFFGNPSAILDEMGDASVLVTPHRFQDGPIALLEGTASDMTTHYGRFNSGVFAFRRTEHAHACLSQWREQCLEWCYNKIEPNRFADQKYLESWPEQFEGIRTLRKWEKAMSHAWWR
jgi:hypothetical protein